MSGSESCGNSMSTTGPVTRATRPTTEVFSAVAVGVIVFFSFGGSSESAGDGSAARRKRVGAADDLGDLLGDLRLTRIVAQAGVVGDELVGVVAGRLHRLLRRGVLGGRRLEKGVEDAALDVDRQERVENRRGVRLEIVEREHLRVGLGGIGL